MEKEEEKEKGGGEGEQEEGEEEEKENRSRRRSHLAPLLPPRGSSHRLVTSCICPSPWLCGPAS